MKSEINRLSWTLERGLPPPLRGGKWRAVQWDLVRDRHPMSPYLETLCSPLALQEWVQLLGGTIMPPANERNLSTGCPKISFFFYISLYCSIKVLSFHSNLIFHTCYAIFRLDYSICVLSRQRWACASIFPAAYFLYSVARICSNAFHIFCRSWKIAQKRSGTWKHNHVYFTLLAYQLKKLLKKLQKSECWVLSGHQEIKFEDKKQRGRMKVL